MKPTLRTLRSPLRLRLGVLGAACALALGWWGPVRGQERMPAPSRTNGSTVPSDIPEGYTIIEGDIQVPLAFLHLRAPNSVWATNFWTNGVVPYEFDANVTAAHRTAMITAMGDWEAAANVDFRARSGDANYVHIQASTGNNSAVGMQGGMQIINIYNWNVEFTMAHELGHCLGIWHEHTRSDRDSFITVNWDNIQDAYESQFALNTGASHYGPYDFDSVMHYDQCGFSIDCAAGATCTCTNVVMTVKPPNQSWQTLIGQRDHLSELDQLVMSFLYPPANWRWVDGNYGGTELGTFLAPYRQFTTGAANTPSGGTLWVQPNTYSAVGTFSSAVTIQAPQGNVLLH
ncbi:MAG TPA: M12 family metallopeptidase [Thermoanaerobaculaceae bacterium]|nr:M12 family metallopeptidase [Thermoanaerobaculaceae bacterium]HPS76694.1 M12 family metallopeptidase [Thermoanaerobaculaceae bacterium]